MFKEISIKQTGKEKLIQCGKFSFFPEPCQ